MSFGKNLPPYFKLKSSTNPKPFGPESLLRSPSPAAVCRAAGCAARCVFSRITMRPLSPPKSERVTGSGANIFYSLKNAQASSATSTKNLNNLEKNNNKKKTLVSFQIHFLWKEKTLSYGRSAAAAAGVTLYQSLSRHRVTRITPPPSPSRVTPAPTITTTAISAAQSLPTPSVLCALLPSA